MAFAAAQPAGKSEIKDGARQLGGLAFTCLVALSAFFVTVLLSVYADSLFALPASLKDARQEDLPAFWLAGRMALDGAAAEAYDGALFQAALPPPNENLLWLNPPHFLLLTAPLGALPYGAARGVMLALTFAALIATARIAGRGPLSYIAISLSPAAYASLLVLQLSPFIVLGLMFALMNARARPLLSGFVLALLTVKPQYGLLVPIFLIATGCWRAIGAAAAFSLALVALSILIFGLGTWSAYFSAVTDGVYEAHASRVFQAMISLAQSAAKLGLNVEARAAVQAGGLLITSLAVWRAARRWPRDAAIGFMLMAAAFASPSLWLYDWLLIVGGLFMFARAGAPWPLPLQVIAGLLWVSILLPLGATTMTASLIPTALLLAVMVAFWAYYESRED